MSTNNKCTIKKRYHNYNLEKDFEQFKRFRESMLTQRFSNGLDHSSSNINQINNFNDAFEKELNTISIEALMTKNKINEMESSFEQKINEINGSMLVLKQAIEVLETTNTNLNDTVMKLENDNKELYSSVSKLESAFILIFISIVAMIFVTFN